MKTLRMLTVVCTLIVVSLGHAGAQPGMRPFHDPSGWFSISLPADWTLSDDPDRSLGAAFIHGFERSDAGGWVRSTLAAGGPQSANGYALPFIGMLALELPRSMSTRAFAEIIRTRLPAGWTRTGEGDARIAGYDAVYQYVTREGMYAVVVGIPTPKATYLLMAGTVNQPERVNTDFATIGQILESLQAR